MRKMLSTLATNNTMKMMTTSIDSCQTNLKLLSRKYRVRRKTSATVLPILDFFRGSRSTRKSERKTSSTCVKLNSNEYMRELLVGLKLMLIPETSPSKQDKDPFTRDFRVSSIRRRNDCSRTRRRKGRKKKKSTNSS